MKYQSGEEIKVGDLIKMVALHDHRRSHPSIGTIGLITNTYDDRINFPYIFVDWIDCKDIPYTYLQHISCVELVRRNGEELLTWI